MTAIRVMTASSVMNVRFTTGVEGNGDAVGDPRENAGKSCRTDGSARRRRAWIYAGWSSLRGRDPLRKTGV
jgi:hypothetical protein